MKTPILMEEALTLMVYAFDFFSRPTLRKWDQTYDGWPRSNGFMARVQFLETEVHLSFFLYGVVLRGETGFCVSKM